MLFTLLLIREQATTMTNQNDAATPLPSATSAGERRMLLGWGLGGLVCLLVSLCVLVAFARDWQTSVVSIVRVNAALDDPPSLV